MALLRPPAVEIRAAIVASRPWGWVAYVLVALTTTVGYAFVLHLWDANPAISPYYAKGGDAFYNLAWARNWYERGNLYDFPLLAAPLRADLSDFPVFMAAQLPFEKLLGLLTGNAIVAFNLLVLLSLPAAAMTAFFAMRRLGISSWLAFAPATVFAFAPRFAGGEERIDLTVFWIVPLSAAMCVLVARGTVRLFERRNGRPRIGSEGVFVLVAAVLTGAGNQYYAFFTVALLSVATLIATLRVRTARPILVSVLLTVIITGGTVLQVTPTLAYAFKHGRNPVSFVRLPVEAQIYALQIPQMLLPIEGHRGPAWIAEKRQFYDARAPWATTEAGQASLGAIAAVGFIALLIVLAVRSARALPFDVDSFAVLNLWALLLSVPSGFGALFNYYINPDIRAYNRISLFISFFALAGLAQIVAYAASHWNWRVPLGARVLGVVSVIVFGVWDQTTPALIPPYAGSAHEFASDARFVSAVEARIGSGAALELPWMRFPESPAAGALVQGDLFRIYLHAKTLRTSFGAAEGRDPFDWQEAISQLQPGAMVRAAVLGGFEGFIVFRSGYADHGAALESQLQLLMGRPIVSPDGTLAFYSARTIRDRVVSADPQIGTPWFVERTVRKIVRVMGPTFLSDDPNAALPEWRSPSSTATILVRNSSSRTRPCELSGLLDLGRGATALHLSTAGSALDVPSAGRPTPFRFRFDAAPGKTVIDLTATRGPAKVGAIGGAVNYALRLIAPTIEPTDKPSISPAADVAFADALAPLATADDFGTRRVRLVDGCWPLESLKARTWNWCGRTARLRLESTRRETLRFSAIAVTPGTPRSRLLVDVGGRRERVEIAAVGTPIHVDVAVSPTVPAYIELSTDARPLATADPRVLVLELLKPTLNLK